MSPPSTGPISIPSSTRFPSPHRFRSHFDNDSHREFGRMRDEMSRPFFRSISPITFSRSESTPDWFSKRREEMDAEFNSRRHEFRASKARKIDERLSIKEKKEEDVNEEIPPVDSLVVPEVTETANEPIVTFPSEDVEVDRVMSRSISVSTMKKIGPDGKIIVAGEKIVKKNGRVISHQKAVHHFEK